jgi:hypothetical protein
MRSLTTFVPALLLVTGAALAEPARYDSAAVAAAAFRAALENGDRDALLAVFGPEAEDLLFTGDAEQDSERREDILDGWAAMSRVSMTASGDAATLYIGREQWPFPFPLARGADGKWAFDPEAGREAVLLRRIGENELDVIALLRAYVGVQRDYRSRDWDGDGVLSFAAHIISAEGARDGLYWPPGDGAPESPVGDFVARAAAEGFALEETEEGPEPYLGYVYHILTSQGAAAPGGSMDYIVNDRMLASHALIAYPAAYGDSGVMSFMVGENGVVLEADLGEDTLDVAGAIESFDPGEGWAPVE